MIYAASESFNRRPAGMKISISEPFPCRDGFSGPLQFVPPPDTLTPIRTMKKNVSPVYRSLTRMCENASALILLRLSTRMFVQRQTAPLRAKAILRRILSPVCSPPAVIGKGTAQSGAWLQTIISSLACCMYILVHNHVNLAVRSVAQPDAVPNTTL